MWLKREGKICQVGIKIFNNLIINLNLECTMLAGEASTYIIL